MNTNYVYPGSFCPPTYGHLGIVKKAASILPKVTVICSRNDEKNNNWFTEKQCVEMWKAYSLPKNVRVVTFEEFVAQKDNNSETVIIRGIRDDQDFDNEKKIITKNLKQFGIDKYLFIMSDEQHAFISSSRVRELVTLFELEALSKFVAPLVITKLLEKFLGINSIFLVVGKPGSGKSTFLKLLEKENSANCHLNTDLISKSLKSVLEKAFPGESLYDLAINKPEELGRIINKPWLEELKRWLKAVPAKSNVFVEIPYGLQPDKRLYRFVGGRVIYVGCKNEKINQLRNLDRGTPQLAPFIKAIPSFKESKLIARRENLTMLFVDTSGSLEDLCKYVVEFNQTLIT